MGNALKSVSIYRIDDPDTAGGSRPAEETGYLHSTTLYDKAGNVLKESDYSHDGAVDHQTEFVYDEQNNLIRVNQYLDGEELTEWKDIIRNLQGVVEKELMNYLDGSVDEIVNTFDTEGKLITRIQTNSDGDIEKQENFEYFNGKISREEVIDYDGNISAVNTYSYSDEGVLEETVHETFNDGAASKQVHIFNEAGFRIKSLVYNAKNQLVEISRFNLDDQNRIISIEDEDQQRLNTTVITYDESGNIIAQVEKDREEEIIASVARLYDAENRVLESRVFMAGHGLRPDQDYLLKYKYEFYE